MAGNFSNLPLSYAQNDTMSMSNMTEEDAAATETRHSSEEYEKNIMKQTL